MPVPPPAPPRPDESRTLLERLAGDLDGGYRTAAQQRSRPPARPGPAVLVTLVLGGALLGTGAAQAQRRAPALEQTREALVREVESRAEQTRRLEREAETLRTAVAAARGEELLASGQGAELSRRVAELELAAATVPVTGPGLVVLLDDGSREDTPLGADEGDPDQDEDDRIQDRDLQDVVNALWAAGAEAIAIDGARLTSTSAIRSAGEAVLVDLQPLSPPYTVRAVGDPDALEERFGRGDVARRFRGYTEVYGIGFDVRREEELRLPASSGATLRSARAGTP